MFAAQAIKEKIFYMVTESKRKNLDPEHYFVPWITFGNVWNKDDFDASLADLQEFLCKHKFSHVPECKEQ